MRPDRYPFRARFTPVLVLAALAACTLFAVAARASCSAPNACIPPLQNCGYSSTCEVLYPVGVEFRRLSLHDFTSCVTVMPGMVQSGAVAGKADLDLSLDAGSTWTSYTGIPASGWMTFSWSHTGVNGEQVYSATLDQLDISGGTMPMFYAIRESPTNISAGQASVLAGQSDYTIDSFFDVFTELSVDGGMTWYPGMSTCRIVLGPTGPTPARTSTWGRLKSIYR